MRFVLSVPDNFQNSIATLRQALHGAGATPSSWRDSYVIDECVRLYEGSPQELLTEEITRLDAAPKNAKSITFKAETWKRVEIMAELLDISETEVVRRIVWYTISKVNANKLLVPSDNKDIPTHEHLKLKLELLQQQLAEATATLSEIKKLL